jgi:hypothetical protein
MMMTNSKTGRGLWWGGVLIALWLTGCQRGQIDVLPTPITDINALATSMVETQQAPPPGFATVQFSRGDV